ncbi:MAG: regulatory protein RecX [Gammaproteobacteria bacterium]|nr:regulatory protein RecX [Gammaproteobacteria bacterium]
MRRTTAEPDDPRAARKAALDALARRDHASAELRGWLEERGYAAAVAESVVAALREERLLDDQRYVEHFIAYHAGRGQGPLRVRAELGRKGVAGELVERALQSFGDWPAVLEAARRKKFGAGRPASFAERARQARFLGYRGFTGAQIRRALGSDVETEDVDI